MSGKFLYGLILSVGLVILPLVWVQSSHAGAPDDARLIASIQGPALFKAYCASCHGLDAKGRGPMAPFLKTVPSDLTHISARNSGTFPLMRIDKIIAGNEELPGGHGARGMPVWGPIFSLVEDDRDLGKVRIDNLARYLRDLQTK